MTTEEHIQYWIQSAEDDVSVAQSLFDSGKFDWSLFIGHLILEKILKANYVRATQLTPPKSHDLSRLAEKARVQLTEAQAMFLERVNDFNLETRYPDEKFEFKKRCTKEFAEENLNAIMELYKWFRSLLMF